MTEIQEIIVVIALLILAGVISAWKAGGSNVALLGWISTIMFACAFMIGFLAAGTRYFGMDWPPLAAGALIFLVWLIGGLVLAYKIENIRRKRPRKTIR